MRRSLGGTDDSVPAGEPGITWRDQGRHIAVTARRDGSYTFQIEGDITEVHLAGTQALLRALTAVHDRGLSFLWPASARDDSVAFRLNLVTGVPNADGVVKPITSNVFAVKAYTVAAPPTTEVKVLRQQAPPYPESARREGFLAVVRLSYLVNEDGRADVASITADWPDDKPRPQGNAWSAYLTFVDAAKQSVANSVFSPKTVGGCAVRSRVTEPFSYCLGTGQTGQRHCAGDRP